MNSLESIHSRSRSWPVAWLLILGLIGCAHHSPMHEPPVDTSEPFSPSGQAAVPDRWWTTFSDPALNRLVDDALGSNFTLAVALERLRTARALARREASDLFPDVNGILNTDSSMGSGPDGTQVVWGLDAAYQVDLWGQIQSRVEAERLRADATDADYHAVALSLAAEVARTWFSLIEAHAQLQLLGEQLETNRTGLKAQELRFGLGFVRSADVLRQRQLVESTLEQEVVARARIEVLEHQLAVLLGALPQLASYDPGTDLPILPPLPDAGVPSELVERRPDVRRDFLALLAADRDLASAISAQYPRLSLTGSVINVAEHPDVLLRDWFVLLGSQLIAPLIDGGQRRAEVDRTAASARQRYDEYGQTILVAFREVEDSLALEHYQIQRIQRLNAQVDLAQQASDQLVKQYLIGDADYLDVLSQIQVEQRLQRDTLSARLELVLIRIGLYLALAGGFDIPAPDCADSSSDPTVAPAEVLESVPGPERLPPPDDLAPEINVDESRWQTAPQQTLAERSW